MKSVISTTFFVILLQESHQNFMWKVVTSYNVNSPLKLFFYLLILANNNLLLKIYCENIVIAFLNCHFLFFILFFLSFIYTFFSFSFFLFFLLHTRIPTLISIHHSYFPFLLHSRTHSPALFSTFSFST